MKGVILAGGKGTRLAPFTDVSNKHLAPIYTPNGAIPMIFYPIQTLIKSGITEILIISSQEHSGRIIEVLGDGDKFGCEFTYKIQDMNNPEKPVGIASALRLSQNFVGDSPFAVVLGDNYYQDTFDYEFKKFEKPIIDKRISGQAPIASVFLKEVYDPERFGVATVTHNEDGSFDVSKIVEKPKEPESNYAVTGLYLYTPHVFTLVPQLEVSDRGELEITDINNWYVQNETMTAHQLRGYWHDAGTPTGVREIEEFINDLSENNAHRIKKAYKI